eukprot:TRINITY_DN49075_c0_g1_i1.p1 TRINITY_DN49075_c0_g1~~TRINITY_DN49075_c0_g1_i1.p1  ORF type:complete len:438 (-),score=96.77 TRINITY_DN49075_c0_g1_i1:346-1659(-)
MLRSLVGSEMCIRDSINAEYGGLSPPLMSQNQRFSEIRERYRTARKERFIAEARLTEAENALVAARSDRKLKAVKEKQALCELKQVSSKWKRGWSPGLSQDVQISIFGMVRWSCLRMAVCTCKQWRDVVAAGRTRNTLPQSLPPAEARFMVHREFLEVGCPLSPRPDPLYVKLNLGPGSGECPASEWAPVRMKPVGGMFSVYVKRSLFAEEGTDLELTPAQEALAEVDKNTFGDLVFCLSPVRRVDVHLPNHAMFLNPLMKREPEYQPVNSCPVCRETAECYDYLDMQDMAQLDNPNIGALPPGVHDIWRWLVTQSIHVDFPLSPERDGMDFDVCDVDAVDEMVLHMGGAPDPGVQQTILHCEEHFPPEEVYLRVCKSGHLTLCLHFDSVSDSLSDEFGSDDEGFQFVEDFEDFEDGGELMDDDSDSDSDVPAGIFL